jgi:hypothetical protein
MSWEHGRQTIDALLANGELQKFAADFDVARQLLEAAQRLLIAPGDRGAHVRQGSRGPERSRTADLTRARGALYQLSYWPAPIS